MTTRAKVLQLCGELQDTEQRLGWLRGKVEDLRLAATAGADTQYVKDAILLLEWAEGHVLSARTLIQDIGGA